MAIILMMVLVPQAVQAFAPPLFGTLRSPGELAFVAGHRGDRAGAPENTLPALQAAFDHDLPFVETDVQLTADGHAVLLHDRTLDRTTDGTGPVAEVTLAELRRLDAGSWFDAKYAGTRVPLLEEFLDLMPAERGTKVMLELKGLWATADLERVRELIYARGVESQIVFASFNLGTISNLGEVADSIPRIVIRRELPDDPVRLARYYGAAALMTSASALETDPTVVADLHDAGISVLVYTLNSKKRWVQATGFGVDGIVTDKPASLAGWIKRETER